MTNTQNLTGAIALLAFIAILDNFIIVELQPGFEGMVLIDASELPARGERGGDAPELHAFWVDKHEVSQADFAKFVEATGYLPQSMTAENSWQLVSGAKTALGVSAEVSHASTEANTGATGESVAQVSHDGALAYCNWLGKSLPTDLQVQAADSRKGDSSSNAPESLHHDAKALKTWIGMDRREGLAIGDSTAAAHPSPSIHNRSDLLSFLCVKNVGA